MNQLKKENSKEIFSFHLFKAPLSFNLKVISSPLHKNIVGLNHSESFFTMGIGEEILSIPRYHLKHFALFAFWSEEAHLGNFLKNSSQSRFIKDGWHVRMKAYRKWGEISEIKNAYINEHSHSPEKPVVAVTLARLKLSQTFRFASWGLPVEKQVKNHKGKTLAEVVMRPLNNFSTFSIWKNEKEMVKMVGDGDHSKAMKERSRQHFHHEFTTIRFTPLSEFGEWKGCSNYIFDHKKALP